MFGIAILFFLFSIIRKPPYSFQQQYYVGTIDFCVCKLHNEQSHFLDKLWCFCLQMIGF